MNSGVSLWNEAKKIIPGGNQLLSKRAEMFLPEQWPAYYQKAKGCEIWDLDDNHYFDLSLMGVGTCILGYANDEISQAVIAAVRQGNMATLNSPEEVALAKKLLELHPWAHMARFARTGGEAAAIAVRIARAYAQRDKAVFCGYHGWSDWYIAANLADEQNLDGQLLPGLKPAGIPRQLKGTALPFHYGDIDAFKDLMASHQGEIGVVIMEVARHKEVDVEFLRAVKKIAAQEGAVLIFDEISSGFRLNAGGMHLLYAVEPDILILGKALGNGYPISAVIGKRDVMDAAQDTFISSTCWTERTGFVAALETIKIYQEKNVAGYLKELGEYLSKGLQDIFKSYSLEIDVVGLASAPIIKIQEKEMLLVKTIFTQEMLKKGFLASTVIYLSYAHTKEIIDQYLKASREVFAQIKQAMDVNTLKDLLDGEVCHSGFKRLA